MSVKFIKRPVKLNKAKPSVSFQDKDISQVSFDSEVEIAVYDEQNVLFNTYKLDGFIFLNSLMKKQSAKNKEIFYVLKL